MNLLLTFKLASDTVFGTGDGIPGLVDTEVEHDPLSGLPIVRGRTIKGLLVEACADLLFLFQNRSDANSWVEAAGWLFGSPGSDAESRAHLRIGDGCMPSQLQQAVAYEVLQGRLQPDEVLSAATTIRRQTAIEDTTGSAKKGSLRSIRAVLKDTRFEIELSAAFQYSPELQFTQMLLAACVYSLNRAGLRRHRGMGRLEDVRLVDLKVNDSTPTLGEDWISQFSTYLTSNGE